MSSEYGAEANDPINIFLEGLASKTKTNETSVETKEGIGASENEPERVSVQGDNQQIQAPEVTKIAETTVEKELNIDSLTPQQQLEVFKRLTNIDINDVESVKKVSELWSKAPDYEKIMNVYPRLIEEIKKKQDIMGFFPDEDTFKAIQLAKDPKFKGRESSLINLFHTDLSKMDDMEVISLGASIEKSPKISNPLRSVIKQIGLDPDDVLQNWDELSQDDKDDVSALADDYRNKLTQLKASINIPQYSSDIEKELIDMELHAKDDFAKRENQMKPISTNIVNEVKELKVTDDFNFKVEMSDNEKQSYADFLTQAVMSGDFDLSTDEGKMELYDALLTEIWVDNRDKIVKAHETFIRNKIEAEYRAKYNNEKPLSNKEPVPPKESANKNPIFNIVSGMISERI